MRSHHPRQQRGAVLVTVALLLLFLMGFMGFAIDFGRLFIVKTELQTALDSCALSAAQELDGMPTSLARASSAGLAAGNLNRVHMQSGSWAGQGQLVAGEITFRDATFAPTTTPAAAKYVQCQHTQPNNQLFLVRALGAFSNDSATFPNALPVGASAVATRGSAQTTCPVPITLKPKTGGVAPDFGFVPGEWVILLMGPGEATNGQIGWANLDGSNSASETERELDGFCGTEVGDQLGTPGVQASVADAWNARFGIYKNNSGPTVRRPDLTGYAYTTNNWPARPGGAVPNAYNGAPPPGAHATAANFVTKRQAFASCADTGTRMRGGGPNAVSCESITGLSLNSFQNVATPGAGAAGGHAQYGFDRRLVVVPVTNSAGNVINYACMLMLQPLTIPMSQVQLEYRGNAGAAGSPCTTSGLPGGLAGPLVPVLVR